MKVNSKHISCALAILSMASLAGFASYSSSVSAITEQSDVNVNFTFNSTLGVSVSSNDLSIDDLAPGTAADSNIITVNVLSNSPYGYTLNSTVGNSTYNNRNLTHATVNNATPFSSIDFGTTKASKESFSNSQWGYSFSLDNGTTWINATKTNGTTNDTGYSGLPLYSDSSHIATIKESSSTSALNGDNVKFKIAAKADTTQIAGEYNNVINFQVTGNAEPVLYMQNWNGCSSMSTGDTITLVDNRDDEEYLVGKLADENCWMLDNLRLDLTDFTILNRLTTANTHVDEISLTSLKSGNRSAGNQYATGPFTTWNSSSTSGSFSIAKANADYKDTIATSYGTGSGKIGVYYNYCAASAGSYCYGNGAYYGNPSGDAPYDLCPAGWLMPTGNYSGDFSTLAKAIYDSTGVAPSSTARTDYNTALSLVFSGRLNNGSTSNQNSYGYWWSSTRNDSANMYYLLASADYVDPVGVTNNASGCSLRCITR